jgi:uncharacterized membrane protein
MTHVDTAILNVTEWACRRFQMLTGRTNVWLAAQLTNLSIVVYFVWAGIYFWSVDDLTLQIFVAAFCSAVWYALMQTVFKVPIEVSESNALRRVANGLRNPRRVRDVPLRVSFVTLSVVLWPLVAFVYLMLRNRIVLLGYSLIALTTLVLYVLACDPLPPAPRTATQPVEMPVPQRASS